MQQIQTAAPISRKELRSLHVAFLQWKEYTKWWMDREVAVLYESLGFIPRGVLLTELNGWVNKIDHEFCTKDFYKEHLPTIQQIREPYIYEREHGIDAYREYRKGLAQNMDDPYLYRGDMDSPVLYHLTDFRALYSILNDDALLSMGDYPNKLFFTTNPDLIEMEPVFYWGEYPRNHTNLSVSIALDFEKLKRLDNISFVLGDVDLGTYATEEEIIATAPDGIRGLSRYILHVDVKKSRLKRTDLQSQIDENAHLYHGAPLPDIMREVEDMLTERGIPYDMRP